VIKHGQDLFLDWVTTRVSKQAQIDPLLAKDVELYDYDEDPTGAHPYVGKNKVLEHLADLAAATQSVQFYPNKALGQQVVGLDHLTWKPEKHMAPHECVDIFELDSDNLVKVIRICFVRSG
jgi:hypothetical protein